MTIAPRAAPRARGYGYVVSRPLRALLFASAAGAALLGMGTAPGCGGAATPAEHPRRTPKEIVQRYSPAIVRVEGGKDRVGTGFIVDGTGLIATNLHVVAGEDDIRVHLFDGRTLAVARIAGLDPDRDLAVLDVDPEGGKPLPIVTFGDSDALTAGDPIITIGNPLGVLDYSVSNGLVSSVRVLGPELKVLQISAPISQGSSGGPLFNQYGEVVGVTTAMITAGQNLNLAVPTNYLRTLLAAVGTPGHTPIALAEFARATTEAPADGDHAGRGPRIVRQIPRHEIAAVDGCTIGQLEEIATAIASAIESGAPLYNQGNHEACFRIYEGTAIRWQREAPCAGVRDAFGDGLLRANSVDSPTEKAWAMRDTFDGLLDAFDRWLQAHPEARPTGHP